MTMKSAISSSRVTEGRIAIWLGVGAAPVLLLHLTAKEPCKPCRTYKRSHISACRQWTLRR